MRRTKGEGRIVGTCVYSRPSTPLNQSSIGRGGIRGGRGRNQNNMRTFQLVFGIRCRVQQRNRGDTEIVGIEEWDEWDVHMWVGDTIFLFFTKISIQPGLLSG